MPESLATDARHARRDGHRGQPSAVPESRVDDAGHGVGYSIVGDRFGNGHIASIFVIIITIRTTSVTHSQLRTVIYPFVIDSFAVAVRYLNIVCGSFCAHQAHEQDK